MSIAVSLYFWSLSQNPIFISSSPFLLYLPPTSKNLILSSDIDPSFVLLLLVHINFNKAKVRINTRPRRLLQIWWSVSVKINYTPWDWWYGVYVSYIWVWPLKVFQSLYLYPSVKNVWFVVKFAMGMYIYQSKAFWSLFKQFLWNFLFAFIIINCFFFFNRWASSTSNYNLFEDPTRNIKKLQSQWWNTFILLANLNINDKPTLTKEKCNHGCFYSYRDQHQNRFLVNFYLFKKTEKEVQAMALGGMSILYFILR